MEQADVIIVGAGLLGCFTARALARYELKTLVLEAREDVCTGVSRANTGILYAGYDTKPGTLKSALTVKAQSGMAALCRELDVPVRQCGSLMLAFGPRGEEVLRRKLAAGWENGVPGLELLGRDAVLAMEPNVAPTVTAGLWAPTAGTLDPWAPGIAAFENAKANGVEFRFNEEIKAIARTDLGFEAETPEKTYRARAVVNCAGLAADRVRELCETPLVRLFPSGGEYLVLDTGAGDFVRHVLFHEPEQKGKGLTAVPTVDGNLLLGPTERDMTERDATEAPGLEEIRRLCGRILPGLDLSLLIRSFGATRPNPYYVRFENGDWVREERSIGSFTVLEEQGLISLMGIKTPGLTCAPELGRYAAEKALAFLGGAAEKTAFDPVRRGIPNPRVMPEAARAAYVKEHPDDGIILCRCRGVSEGEVKEAIRRGAVTVDGVKRRTGAGMGRCQGSFCMERIMELLAQDGRTPLSAVRKDGPETEVSYGTF